MQTEYIFDELTARDVAERLRVRAEIDAYLNAVALTVARINGCAPTDRVSLNAMGTGVIVSRAFVPGEGEESAVYGDEPDPAFAKATAGKTAGKK